MRTRTRFMLAGLTVLIAAALAACSGAQAGEGKPSMDPSIADVQVSAAGMKFEQASVTLPAGKAFTIGFANADNMPHNVAIFDGSGAKVFEGELVTATSTVYEVPALAAGSYRIACTLHPNMTAEATAQ